VPVEVIHAYESFLELAKRHSVVVRRANGNAIRENNKAAPGFLVNPIGRSAKRLRRTAAITSHENFAPP
jgi:ribonuclease HI